MRASAEQRRREGAEAAATISSLSRSLQLAQENVNRLAPLAAKNIVPQNELANAQREVVDLQGRIAAARVVQKDDDLTIMTSNGVVIRLKVKDVKQSGRATRGVHLIKPQDGDSVASVARISAEDLKKAGAQVDEKEAEPQPKLV